MVTSGLRDDWKTGGRSKNGKQYGTESVVVAAAAAKYQPLGKHYTPCDNHTTLMTMEPHFSLTTSPG